MLRAVPSEGRAYAVHGEWKRIRAYRYRECEWMRGSPTDVPETEYSQDSLNCGGTWGYVANRSYGPEQGHACVERSSDTVIRVPAPNEYH